MLYLLVFFAFYLPFQLATNIAPGYDLASVRILAIFIFLAWTFKSLAQRKINIPNKIQTLLIISFLFLNFLSLFFADNFNWAIRKLLFLLSFVPLYFVFADVLKDKTRREKLIKSLIIGTGLISLMGIFQFLLQFFIGLDSSLNFWNKIIAPFLGSDFSQAVFKNPSWLVNLSGKTVFRAIAFFPDPHMFAFYLNMVLPFSLTLFLKDRKKIFLFFFFTILIADLLTFSRGGYLGLFIELLIALFLLRNLLRNKVSPKIKLAFCVAFLLIFSAIAISPIRNRFFSSFNFSEGSNQGRIETWSKSLEIIGNNPLTGVGIGNYALAIKPSATYREPIYSHNLYLDIAAETGIITAIIFIILLLFSIRSFNQNKKKDIFNYPGILSIAAFFTHSLFETPLYSIHILPLLILILALSTQKHE